MQLRPLDASHDLEAFIFIMLTILGNTDVSVIYAVSPLLGALLIIIYVVGIFFVIMNLFYAIIVSTSVASTLGMYGIHCMVLGFRMPSGLHAHLHASR